MEGGVWVRLWIIAEISSSVEIRVLLVLDEAVAVWAEEDIVPGFSIVDRSDNSM